MLYRQYNPPPPLTSFVECFWYAEGFEGTHQRERLLPNGESSIIFDLREQPVRIFDALETGKFVTYAPAIFAGARTDCFVIETSQQERVIGVQFRPGGAFPFLAMPASEVSNATFSLDDIWPRQAPLIREALMNAGSVEAKFAVLEQSLTERLRRSLPLHPAVAYAVGQLARSGEGMLVRDVADHVGLSSRRFIELFREQTGLPPKAFQRVRRFQGVLRTLRADSVENWTSIAYRCGYFDQPHFIHDFRLFSGMTPGEYVAAATLHMNHVPLA